MSKKEVKPDPPGKLINTQQTEAYREQMRKEKWILSAKTKADIDRLDNYFQENNNYLSLYNKEGVSPGATKVDALDQKKFYSTLPFHNEATNDFEQKSRKDKYNHLLASKEKELAKDVLKFPLTSNQSYGWMEPIDNLNLNVGIKNSFPEALMGKSIRQQEIKKEKTYLYIYESTRLLLGILLSFLSILVRVYIEYLSMDEF